MAQLTKSNAAAYGHQGARGRMAFLAGGRPEPISLRHCFQMDQARGYPSEYFSKIGAVHTASAESEGAAAATPSALNTPTGATLTPAGFLIALAVNNDAEWRSLEENSPMEIAAAEIRYGCGIYMMDDPTVGLGALYDTVTATDGDTGAALTLDGILDVAATIRANLDDANLGVSVIIDGKGAEDVNRDIINNASAFLGNPAVSKFVQSFVDTDGMAFDESDGYWMSPDGRSGVFVEAGYGMLVQQGGDRVGCGMISPTEVIQNRPIRLSSKQTGKRRIAPAFAICTQVDPVSAGRFGNEDRYEEVVTPGGIVVMSYDANIGADFGTVRGRGKADVALVNDNSACECRYLA